MLGQFFGDLVVVASRLTSWHAYYDLQSQARPAIKATEADDARITGEMPETFARLSDLARALDMASVMAQIPRVVTVQQTGTPAQLAVAINDLLTRLGDELKQREFLYVAPLFANLYKNPIPFGGRVEAAFPSVIFDIREAAQCAAVGRPTAAVLHLMRVLDGLMQRGINPRLRITLTRPSWGSYISAIRTKVADKPTLPRVNWKRDAAFFTKLAADLDAIRILWRNPAMHDIATQYSPQEALVIMGAVRQFADDLSARVRETGRLR